VTPAQKRLIAKIRTRLDRLTPSLAAEETRRALNRYEACASEHDLEVLERWLSHPDVNLL